NCVGCFGCWCKTPGKCVIPDGYGDFGKRLGACGEYLILSRVVYGGFSPFVKNVLDRNIGYILPFFELRKGEMHHKPRYPDRFRLRVFGYGEEVSPEEQAVFRRLAEANGLNLNAQSVTVRLGRSPEELAFEREGEL
ncbi:MAG: flavodoxin family protein, partial [Oscillospiraceae bacterium]|nr:flavodoxin family protein [Oscillospiraceae bacterium]